VVRGLLPFKKNNRMPAKEIVSLSRQTPCFSLTLAFRFDNFSGNLLQNSFPKTLEASRVPARGAGQTLEQNNVNETLI
jgi:hypothetical protein